TQAMIMIDRAIERGEVHETVDRNLILDLLIAPLYWRSVVRQTRVTSADISTLVQLVASFAKD
ncbi:MAG: TetR-like C-terminal domain-containing protein, partial [Roseovarius sp.]